MRTTIFSIIAMLSIVGMNAQNNLYVEVGSSNTTAKVPVYIYMTNEVTLAGFQSSYKLPYGLTKENFIYDEDEEQYVELNSVRCVKVFINAKEEMFTLSKPNDLLLSVTAGVSDKTIAAGDGLVGTFYIDASTLSDGTYTILQYTATLFPNAFSRIDLEDTEASFTIMNGRVLGSKADYLLGDVNGDGSISVTDVGMIISHILEKTPTDFNTKAADMNGDGDITVTDVGVLITKILSDE